MPLKTHVMTKKPKQKSSEKIKTQGSSASKLRSNKLGQYVVYDKKGKIIILTTHKRIAERYLDDEG